MIRALFEKLSYRMSYLLYEFILSSPNSVKFTLHFSEISSLHIKPTPLFRHTLPPKLLNTLNQCRE